MFVLTKRHGQATRREEREGELRGLLSNTSVHVLRFSEEKEIWLIYYLLPYSLVQGYVTITPEERHVWTSNREKKREAEVGG